MTRHRKSFVATESPRRATMARAGKKIRPAENARAPLDEADPIIEPIRSSGRSDRVK